MQEMKGIQVYSKIEFKTYSESQVLEIKSKLEHRSGIRLDLKRTSSLEISLTCHNLEKYHCGLKYLFRKINENPENTEYLLHTEFQSHDLECIAESRRQNSPRHDEISSPSFKRYKPPKLQHSSESFSLNHQKLPSPIEHEEKSENLNKYLQEQYLSLKERHSAKFYTEDEVSSLKKQLQFQSKGYISKSTEFHPEFGYVSKIAFKCKYQNNNCPYLATLTYTFQRNAKNQKLYKLQKIHTAHSNSCLLEDEDIHFNFVTRKIDENFNILLRIISKNSLDIKPKVNIAISQRVLELFSKELEEQPDFIYKGITSKHHKRAAKKYFDNSVAKARNQLK